MKYITKQQYHKNPSEGEINTMPSKTIEGEYMEMKDILDFARRGSDIKTKDVQYFRPEEITQINHFYRNSHDLTDIDALRQKTKDLQSTIQKAVERKRAEKAELAQAMEDNKKETENKEEE